MSKNYSQLSLEQRYQIEAFIKVGMKQKDIAHNLGVSPSTISRELRRNIACHGRTAGQYLATNAHRKTLLRHKMKPKEVVFTEQVKKGVAYYLTEERWSPEFISKCEQNKGKELKVNTLKQYAEQRVVEITGGKQQPTSRQETMKVDWYILK